MKDEQKQHLIDMMQKDEELGLYDIFNDEKKRGIKKFIDEHKQNKMKQTAVEWLDQEIECILMQVFDGFLTFAEFMEEREKLFKQAKEMEEQQIKDAFIIGINNGLHGYKVSEEYYKKTFKK